VIRITGGADRNVPHLTGVARLTHDPEFSESPTWSPDGKMLAFSSNRNGNYEIYVRRIEGGQEVNVTYDPGQDFQPAFSPDGNWIAFVSTRSSRTGMVKIGGNGFISELRTLGGDVWVIPALGGQARLLARDGNFPTWHPNGTKVLYMGGLENHRAVMEVTADGGTPRAVLPSESSNWEIVTVAYSPSGRWITFETDSQQVFVLPASGGAPRELLNGISSVWDPYGQRMYYFTREPAGGTRLSRIEIDEGTGKLKGEPKTVGLLTGLVKDLAISLDGRHLAASELEGSLNLTRLPLNANGDAPAGPEEVLSSGQVFDRHPAMSLDGRSIAYMSNRLGPAELWILRLGTTHPIRLDLPGQDAGVIAANWLPDSQKLSVVRGSSTGKNLLWIVAADGSHAEQLPVPPFIAAPGEGYPVSPDGRTIPYISRSGSNYQLFAFDLITRQSRQITTTPGDKYSGSWSPDGRWVVYSSNASGSVQVWRIGANGGQPERMTRGDDRIRHAFYSPDGRWLYYQPNHQNIYGMPAGGGPAQQVTHFPEAGLFIEEPTISPDDRYLVYCRSHGGSSLWVLTVGTGGSEHD
jgi:Tol biopolymer transport system component